MFIVWECNAELARSRWIAKGEAGIVTRRNSRMTVRTDDRLSALKKLLAMTAYASVMIRVVGNVGKASYLLPIGCWYLMAGLTGFLMLFSGMGKACVVYPRTSPR